MLGRVIWEGCGEPAPWIDIIIVVVAAVVEGCLLSWLMVMWDAYGADVFGACEVGLRRFRLAALADSAASSTLFLFPSLSQWTDGAKLGRDGGKEILWSEGRRKACFFLVVSSSSWTCCEAIILFCPPTRSLLSSRAAYPCPVHSRRVSMDITPRGGD